MTETIKRITTLKKNQIQEKEIRYEIATKLITATIM